MVIGIPLLLIANTMFGADVVKAVGDSLVAVVGALMIPVFGFLFWFKWTHRKQQVKADAWKQRISSVADCTDEPYCHFTLNDFCYYTDETELKRTVEILQQMPEGHRKLKDAYAEVLEKCGGPL